MKRKKINPQHEQNYRLEIQVSNINARLVKSELDGISYNPLKGDNLPTNKIYNFAQGFIQRMQNYMHGDESVRLIISSKN